MSFALDVNILLYASDESGPYFEKARSFIESCIIQQEVFYLGWPTVMSYLRISTHFSVFDHPLSPKEAMGNIETLINLPHVRFLSEGKGFWEAYRTTTKEVPPRGTLYTHDRDFLKFSFLDVRDPLL
jgi:predicted nucleic acid-binding protein